MRCGKCGCDLRLEAEEKRSEPTAAPKLAQRSVLEAALQGRRLGDADWELEAELRGVHRLVSSLQARRDPFSATQPVPAPHVIREATFAGEEPASERSNPRDADAMQGRSLTIGWVVLSLGLAIFACGAVLLGWSLLADRPDLWPLGMPLALVGQAALILGLVLQLDGLWNASRKTVAVLHELDGELKNVRHATSLLSSSHSASGQSFYLHLAEGASPQLLLTDLKGQMDLLAQQMAKHGR